MCAAAPYLLLILFVVTFLALLAAYVTRAVDKARAACSRTYDISVFIGRETSRDAVLADRFVNHAGIDARDIDRILRCRRQVRRVGLGIFLLTGLVFLAVGEALPAVCS
ncbi:hypothetical protein [Enterovirga rhinocerotis]|uniref:Uncharacterized protein n=1 Tax=Enterovirga rhinocerotis TaxID=1339210 RepID=A0A4R7C820_9HYPH|nr:hypothetical protein [Enterovirga rhinocerotis]TDR94122.1 hypothetical protein EV668_1396 [Enterovirga rhinocerotis]